MLPLRFNVINSFFSRPHNYDKNNIIEVIESPEIIHYAGNAPRVYYKNYYFHKKKWWAYKRASKIGLNNINFNYIKSMLQHYLSATKFVVLNLQSFPRAKPSTISINDVLNKINLN